jgi:succinoglycan biosynthesis protein ExoO
MADPLVSVIIPAYRAAATIGRAVRSLLAQSEEDWEAIIIADDGADYAALLADDGLSDARLRFCSSGREAGGAPAARNIGLAAARGRLVTPLDADDLFAAERLARLAPLALAAGAVIDNVGVVDDDSGVLLGTAFPIDRPEERLESDRFLAGSTPLKALVRRSLFPGWDEALRLCDDVVVNLRLFDRLGAIALVATPLQEYRVRRQSICHSPDAAARAERDYGYILDRLAADGYGLADPVLRRAATAAFTRKRELNRAFDAAYRAGRAANFQEFVAGLAATDRPPA